MNMNHMEGCGEFIVVIGGGGHQENTKSTKQGSHELTETEVAGMGTEWVSAYSVNMF